jgi:ribosomal-protein-serine acetyltransferase
MKTEPLLLDIPESLETPRLVFRIPRAGDGPMVRASVQESLNELKQWMPWAKDDYGDRDGEEWCRRSMADFINRIQVSFILLTHAGEHLGNVGLFAFDWDVPKCETGYWLRTKFVGQGYMTEAVNHLTAMAFQTLGAARVQIHADEFNQRSWRVAERCGFTFEGTFRNEYRYPDGRLRNTRVYSKIVSPNV